MRQLTLNATLEYYDVPQIITATDATGTRYLCTLYAQEPDGYRYLDCTEVKSTFRRNPWRIQ